MNIPYPYLYDHMKSLAEIFHRGQMYGDDDYFQYHIMPVANLVQHYCYNRSLGSEVMMLAQCVALGHDLFEDTKACPVLLDDILEAAGHDYTTRMNMIGSINRLTYVKGGSISRDEYLRVILEDPIATIVKECDAMINYQKSVSSGSEKRAEKYKRIIDIMRGDIVLPEVEKSLIYPTQKG